MICPDCEFEVEKLNKKGICKRCAKRVADAKYKDREYIPLKDCKDSRAYKIVKKRIEIESEKENKELIEEKVESEIERKKDRIQIAEEVVEKDIKDRIKKLNINPNIVEMPLELVLESFVRIFNKSIVNEKTLLKNEYEVFITDRLHKLLHTDDFDEIAQIGLEEKQIEERRTKLKRELNLYSPFSDIIEDLIKDDVFKARLDVAIDEYERIKKSYEKQIYVSNTLSMQDLDFTIKSKNKIVERKLAERKPMKKFYAAVPCNNLYGNRDKTLFEANGGIIAENEEIAKQRLKDILKQFNGIFYNEKDIIIREYNEANDIVKV